MLHAPRAQPRLFAGLAAVALSFGLAACGDDSDHDTSSLSSDTETASNGDVFNEADVEFATNMIPHHAQAIQMVTLTDTRTLDAEVKQLAENIRAAQSPEVETMVDWLTAWDKEVPATSMDHSHGDDMSQMPDMEGMDDLPGMMSADEMLALADAPDAQFQDMWLQMMQEHHEGAIEMAKTEQEDGKFPDAIALAMSIETAQEAEIDQIKQLLGS
jgi:uncharacterized protein (DUF305 family)